MSARKRSADPEDSLLNEISEHGVGGQVFANRTLFDKEPPVVRELRRWIVGVRAPNKLERSLLSEVIRGAVLLEQTSDTGNLEGPATLQTAQHRLPFAATSDAFIPASLSSKTRSQRSIV